MAKASAAEMASWDPRDRARYLAAWRQTTEGRAMIAIGLAIFKSKLTYGLARQWVERQSTWTPLAPKYQWRKQIERLSPWIWNRTGATLDAVTNNPPRRIGTTRRVRFGINFYSDRAFIVPETIFDRGKGRPKATGKLRKQIFARLNYGPAAVKLAQWKASRETEGAGFAKFQRVWLSWAREDLPEIAADVEEALVRVMKEAGLEARYAPRKTS